MPSELPPLVDAEVGGCGFIDDERIGLSEDESVERLGLVECNDLPKRYTLAELVDLPRRRVRAWIQAGLIESIAHEQGTDHSVSARSSLPRRACVCGRREQTGAGKRIPGCQQTTQTKDIAA